MGDSSCRKEPPDRKSGDDDSLTAAKKSKKEIKEDALMSDKMIDAEECFEQEPERNVDSDRRYDCSSFSYKDSLLGFKGKEFNGVAFGSSDMGDDPLLSDLLDQQWELPEPFEEIKKLMNVYPVVPISLEEFNEDCRPWNNSLIVTVLGTRFNLYRLKERLSRLWGFSDFEFIDLPNNYYIVRFNEEGPWGEQYKKVLFEGPWVVAKHSVLVQRWSPHFDPFHNALGRIATWVRIPNIPIHCYSKKFLWRLGDRIGKTLKVDLHTIANLEANRVKVERGRFARICVEIDLQKKLVPRVICSAALFNIEYEGLSLICFACGRYGHRQETCPWKLNQNAQPSTSAGDNSANPPPKMSPEMSLPVEGETFGPWMFVRNSTSARNSKPESSKSRFVENGYGLKAVKKGENNTYQSKFSALADLEEEAQDIYELTPSNLEGHDKTLEGSKSLVVYEEEMGGQNKKLTVGKEKMKKINLGVRKENIKPSSFGAQTKLMGSKDNGVKFISSKAKVGQKKGSSRTHLVVSGNLNSTDSNFILNQRGSPIQLRLSKSPVGQVLGETIPSSSKPPVLVPKLRNSSPVESLASTLPEKSSERYLMIPNGIQTSNPELTVQRGKEAVEDPPDLRR